MSKKSAPDYPRTIDGIEKKISQEPLSQYSREGNDFATNIVIGDESWVHHYHPENKRQDTAKAYEHSINVLPDDNARTHYNHKMTKIMKSRTAQIWYLHTSGGWSY